MSRIIKINTVGEYNDMLGVETLHPLVSVVDFSQLKPFDYSKIEDYRDLKGQLGVYLVFLKNIKCGNIRYGVNNYDYDKGSLIFMSPGQVFGVDGEDAEEMKTGYALIFHPDLLLNSSLAKNIKNYTFFSYEVSEALHLSAREREIVNGCFDNIAYELEHAIDAHSKTLIVSYLELFLNYCKRFYERQFNTRSHANKDILVRFEKVLDDYFSSEEPLENGLPSVGYCADKLFISPNYLGDLLKKETGKSAQEHIQFKVLSLAKEKVFDVEKSISQIAYELGFKHPQHFTRMFKSKVGYSPSEYRNLN